MGSLVDVAEKLVGRRDGLEWFGVGAIRMKSGLLNFQPFVPVKCGGVVAHLLGELRS